MFSYKPLSSSSDSNDKLENETTNTPLSENFIITPDKDLYNMFCDKVASFDLDLSNNCRKQCRCKVIIHKPCLKIGMIEVKRVLYVVKN